MKKMESAKSLRELILAKEAELHTEGEILKDHFNIKPINIINNIIKDLIYSPELKSTIVNATIGFTTGFVAKKVLVGKSQNVLTQLAGVVLEIVIAHKVSNNADEIKAVGSILMKKIINEFRG